MNKILKMIESFTVKLRQASTGWDTKSGRAFQQRILDEMDADLRKYNVDDLMNYIAIKETRTEPEGDPEYPTINFRQQ